jgi:phosphoglycolate phosphatase-like HAD superfamily hydrolase
MLDRDVVAAQAARLLEQLPRPVNAAVVFDIDDTLIDGKDGSSIPAVIALYRRTRQLGYTTFIVTNRVAGYGSYTDRQLASVGVTGYVSSYFRSPGENDFWGAKRSARKHIAERGYTTVMSIGDKPWDIGEYGGYGVIIPAASGP